MSEFNFQKAQKYELQSHIHWIEQQDTYNSILADIDSMKEGVPNPHYFNEFFLSSSNLWEMFTKEMGDKICMEIAGGICGVLPLWKNWLKGRKISIDPLILKCDHYLKSRGRSWFDGIELVDVPAEIHLSQYDDVVDGFILWRNGLDHMEDPIGGIKNISSYAKKGCKLLFWSDIKHPEEPDDGHKNLFDRPEQLSSLIESNGWELLYETPKIHKHLGFIEFGGVFTKI